jgi:hypothetical protein
MLAPLGGHGFRFGGRSPADNVSFIVFWFLVVFPSPFAYCADSERRAGGWGAYRKIEKCQCFTSRHPLRCIRRRSLFFTYACSPLCSWLWVKEAVSKTNVNPFFFLAGSPDALFRGYLYLCAHLVASSLRHELLDPLQILNAQVAAKWHARGVAIAAVLSLPVAAFTFVFVRRVCLWSS